MIDWMVLNATLFRSSDRSKQSWKLPQVNLVWPKWLVGNLTWCTSEEKKITKKIELRGKVQNGKSLIKWQNQKLKHIKRMDNNCYIPALLQTFWVFASSRYYLWYRLFDMIIECSIDTLINTSVDQSMNINRVIKGPVNADVISFFGYHVEFSLAGQREPI